MSKASIRYLRVWEVNRDGTLAGLAATCTDIDEHAPTRMKIEGNELVLYGELVHRDLFRRWHGYALEIWGNVMTAPARGSLQPRVVPDRWAYIVFPLARPAHEVEVDDDTLERVFPKYRDEDGAEVDSVRFELLAGNAWADGPHPVQFADIDGELQPVHLDPIRSDMRFMGITTNMSPTAALQYSDHIKMRQAADIWPE
jgi:hypothetical protein